MAQQTTVRTFLEDLQTKVAAVLNKQSAIAFPRVWIMPGVSVGRLLINPRWPTATINDEGGEVARYSRDFDERVVSVTIIDCWPRDHVGERSLLEVLDLGDQLVDALAYNTSESIFRIADSDVSAFETEGGLIFVAKTYRFRYELRRQ